MATSRKIVLSVIFFSLLFLSQVAAQDKREKMGEGKNHVIEQRIEFISESYESENMDFVSLLDNLSHYYDYPINLNDVKSRESLRQLYLLNEVQINNLHTHIIQNGKLISIYELQAVSGFDLETIRLLLPFVRVSTDIDIRHTSFKEMLHRSASEYYLRWGRTLEQQKGFSPVSEEELEKNPNARYLGSPDKLYTRYRFRYMNNISLGVTGEKDAGEEFFKGSQKHGFDFYSAHFYLRDFGRLKTLAIGDYHIEFGQGLTLWSGLSFGKSSELIGAKRNAFGIRPYASTDENRFMRGAAVTGAFGRWEATTFYSHKRRDATLLTTDNQLQEEVIISSFQQTGLHRTPRELQSKKAIGERYIGGHVAYKANNFQLGATSYYMDLIGNLDRAFSYYNQFEFAGRSNAVGGIDYNYVVGNCNFFGEMARSQNGGTAQLHGLLAVLDAKLHLSLLYRDIGANFQNLLFNAFSESSNSLNERGLFSGVELRPASSWRITGYYDIFTFPWLRYQIGKPATQGSDCLIQVNWKPSRNLEMYGRIRQRTKDADLVGSQIIGINTVVQTIRTNYRYDINYKISKHFRLRSRVEKVVWHGRDMRHYDGLLIYQDVVYSTLEKPFSFSFRYALFDTENYDTRIYAYEQDVLYFYSTPAYYGRGSRIYLSARYKGIKKIDIWLKVGRFYRPHSFKISSGLNEISGNKQTEVRMQIRLVF